MNIMDADRRTSILVFQGRADDFPLHLAHESCLRNNWNGNVYYVKNGVLGLAWLELASTRPDRIGPA